MSKDRLNRSKSIVRRILMAIEAAGDASYSFLETYDEAKSIATNTSKIVSELTVVLSDIKG